MLNVPGGKIALLEKVPEANIETGISGSISRGVEKTADTKGVDEQVISWGLVPQPWEVVWDRWTEGTGH